MALITLPHRTTPAKGGFDLPGDDLFSIFEEERQLAAALARRERIEALPPDTRAVVSEPIGGCCDLTLRSSKEMGLQMGVPAGWLMSNPPWASVP